MYMSQHEAEYHKQMIQEQLAPLIKRIEALEAGQPQTPLGPCTQCELDAWIETIDSKNSRLLLMWMERALKAEDALTALTRPESKP